MDINEKVMVTKILTDERNILKRSAASEVELTTPFTIEGGKEKQASEMELITPYIIEGGNEKPREREIELITPFTIDGGMEKSVDYKLNFVV
ncbi:MAG: hypothetical protein CVV02_04035 [Firmicutes bacterium HGW-Firmicutes-7]|nr:MAG: hypothetical protein CVV02_04035 [Firmicutes bacterium HGW-Firmicutes-7]